MIGKVVAAVTALAALVAAGVVMLAASLVGAVDTATDTAGQGCGTDTVVPVSAAATATKGSGIAVAAAVAVRYWTPTEAVTAVAVSGAESRWRATATNPRSSASGMWQIMLSVHGPKFRGDDWRDPTVNGRVAHQVWREARGRWSPWVGYTSGEWREFVPQARAAVAAAGAAAEPTVRRAVAVPAPSRGLRPVAATAEAAVRSRFGFTGTIWGSATSGHMTGSKHYQGLALDVMTSDRRTGDEIAAFFAGVGAARYHVDNVIWNRRITNAGRGWEWGLYTGESPHTDHVHIDFTDVAGQHPQTAVGQATETAPGCDDSAATGAPGAVVYPLPAASGSRDARNYGHGGSRWAAGHTGTDLSVACGTPVLAATSGTVVIDPFATWSGRWLVKVARDGPGSLTTWYAHMQAVTVAAGDTVRAGDTIGRVGSEGNSTGCHLHFEVHPRGGAIYADGIDPSPWLAANVGRATATPVTDRADTGEGGVTVASFNVLGASHTRPGGTRAEMLPARPRMRFAIDALTRHSVDVAGLQELQDSQAAHFDRVAGDTYARWAPPGDTDNSVIWRRDTFRLTDTRTVSVPYFEGRTRRMPLLRLVHRSGEAVWVLNVHNPADTRRFPRQGRWRSVAVAREIARVRDVHETTGEPVLWVGDLNERAPFAAKVAAAGLRVGADGGIDWVVAAGAVPFGEAEVVRGPVVGQASDHPLVVVEVGGR